MRSRRDPFGRVTYRPALVPTHQRRDGCAWCGATGRLWIVRVEPDAGRPSHLGNKVCSWSCAEALADQRIAR